MWNYINPWSEPSDIVETAFALTMSEEEYNELLSTGTDYDMGHRIADAYNKCDAMGVGLKSESPEPYFKGRHDR